MNQTFDIIVIGAGSAGCAVTARLARDTSATVCVLEAGPSDATLAVKIPFGLIHLMGHPTRDWRRETLPMTGVNGRRVKVPRGRMLGGSGSINSMVWFRGRRADYTAWQQPGWDADTVWSAFSDVEEAIRPAPLPDPHPLSTAFGASIGGALTPETVSSGVFTTNMRHGQRFSAADGFLRPACKTGRVEVVTNAQVATLRVANGRAHAVTLIDGREINARAGIVVSAGAIESPAILLRSGIGPATELARLGIAITADVQEVGANLHDHPAVPLHHAGDAGGYGLTLSDLPGWALAPARYVISRKGRLSSNMVEAGAFLSSDGGDEPDLQVHFIPAKLGWQGKMVVPGKGYTADVAVCRPKSRGRLSLTSADPREAPAIDLGLFKDESDLLTLERGVTRLRDLLDKPCLSAWRAPEAFPGRDTQGASLRDHIRNRAGTSYHPVGSVGMGRAVDHRLAVHGVRNLWVADASVMPSITSANTNAPAMMIGWHGAGFISEDIRRTA
ncbi:choline dehydrogenase-like flavoprotein [Rubricella aquisinus]|uniref:Choline dehydrogenase-like flavoprotein n=1 Tax=Rubricella aquisinus TaxID=2028108 RepID=A0A840X1Z6_9RHOB|nr:GMC oxidoreductase [Rubricella aquisinus]MBB5514697.1 choline dehydrogenase-like flavoprotein [Rubricella aquisinus]